MKKKNASRQSCNELIEQHVPNCIAGLGGVCELKYAPTATNERGKRLNLLFSNIYNFFSKFLTQNCTENQSSNQRWKRT